MSDLRSLLPAEPPARPPAGHKGTFGSLLIVAGSRPYPGAAILTATGAGRSGVGLVHLCVPSSLRPLVVPAVPWAIAHECPESDTGGLALAALDPILAAAASCHAAVIGPGLGREADTMRLVTALLTHLTVPVVLDADGLFALARHTALPGRDAVTVLTPHPGEFARIEAGAAPGDRADDDEQRRARAAAHARRAGTPVVVVLKGRHTVVTDGQRAYVEAAGNSGMGTGGTGDVLAGVVGALLCRLTPEGDPAALAALGVHVHARAGDLAADALGQAGVLATDVAREIGPLLDPRD